MVSDAGTQQQKIHTLVDKNRIVRCRNSVGEHNTEYTKLGVSAIVHFLYFLYVHISTTQSCPNNIKTSQ